MEKVQEENEARVRWDKPGMVMARDLSTGEWEGQKDQEWKVTFS